MKPSTFKYDCRIILPIWVRNTNFMENVDS